MSEVSRIQYTFCHFIPLRPDEHIVLKHRQTVFFPFVRDQVLYVAKLLLFGRGFWLDDYVINDESPSGCAPGGDSPHGKLKAETKTLTILLLSLSEIPVCLSVKYQSLALQYEI